MPQERVERLFELDPSEFIAARDALVRQLRDRGEGDLARQVQALRRPTTAAWALNQLVRASRSGVDELTAVGADLRRAQRRAMSGLDAAPLREAQQRRRVLIDRLTAEASRMLLERGTAAEPHIEAVRETLVAATADPEAAGALQTARLSRPLPAPSGFGELVALHAVDEPEPAVPPAAGREGPREDRRRPPRRGHHRAA
jgi:hypothetical protein